jgi:aspartate racemase
VSPEALPRRRQAARTAGESERGGSLIESGSDRTLGIIGGAGPGASARMYLDLAAQFRAATGRLPSITLWNVPFSDAVERSFFDGESDGSVAMGRLLAQSVDRLLAAGATVIAMPCNTLQRTAARESERRGVRFIDMIAATLDAVRASGHQVAVLIATEATHAAGLYEGHDVEILAPPAGVRDETAVLIARAVDGRRPPSDAEMRGLVGRASRPGACVVLGCTDLCGLLDGEGVKDVDVVDSLACLVSSCAEALGAGARV